MKALTYVAPHKMSVVDVPDPRIEEPDDIVIKVTATAICGSDLHMYNGFLAPFMKTGDVMGHEFMGVVEEVGANVKSVKKGDRVVVPFVISCGHCFFCDMKLPTACEVTNPDPGSTVNRGGIKPPAALYGYTHLYGGVPGGQAEYARVRKADANVFKVPHGLRDDQVLFLTDILPTGYQAAVNGRVKQGSSVAIFGAGPVGMMSALSAKLLGAEKIYVIDDQQYRLDFCRDAYGVTPVRHDKVDDVVKYLMDETSGRGVDTTIDAVGFEAKGNIIEDIARALAIETGSGTVLRDCIGGVRRGGTVSVPGVYAGWLHGFLMGDAFDKGLNFAMGQTNVQNILPELMNHIAEGHIDPSAIITHRIGLEGGPDAYGIFAKKAEECRKVVMYPHGMPAVS